jgi:hypothetical protein
MIFDTKEDLMRMEPLEVWGDGFDGNENIGMAWTLDFTSDVC